MFTTMDRRNSIVLWAASFATLVGCSASSAAQTGATASDASTIPSVDAASTYGTDASNDGSTSSDDTGTNAVDSPSNPSPSSGASASNDGAGSVSPADASSAVDAFAVTDGGFAIATAVVSRDDPDSGALQNALPGAVAANNAFAVDLYSHVLSLQADAGPANVLTSPVSASLALTMTYAGAVGQTAAGMATALHFGPAASSIFDGQNALSAAIASRAPAALSAAVQNVRGSGQATPSQSDYELTVVNSVWGEQTYTWQAPFLGILAQSYGTGVYLQDFIHHYDQARLNINAWVSSETADKINNLLPPRSLDDLTRMVLVNAIHLKLPWDQPFTASATTTSDFTRVDGTTVSSTFMNQTLTVPYVDDGQAQIVGLPLSGHQVSVLIALPHPGVDRATYEAGLTTGSAALAQPPSPWALVALALPKANFTSPTISLALALQAMGMGQAFDRTTADFTGMCAHPSDNLNLYISGSSAEFVGAKSTRRGTALVMELASRDRMGRPARELHAERRSRVIC